MKAEIKWHMKLLALYYRFMNPGYSYCMRCKMPWNHCKSKSVPTVGCYSTFATCDKCWDSSSLEELKEYYTKVYFKQKASLQGTRHKMEYPLTHLLNRVEEEYNKTKGKTL